MITTALAIYIAVGIFLGSVIASIMEDIKLGYITFLLWPLIVAALILVSPFVLIMWISTFFNKR